MKYPGYGRLVVTEQAGQYNFIENGITLFSSYDIEQVEMTVHFAMSQRPDARQVLLIGGGAAGTAKEIIKYPNAIVTYVELDPDIVSVSRKYLPHQLDDDRIEVVYTDGRRFLRTTEKQFDVVLIDMPDPASAQINRYYTRQCFEEVKRTMVPGGVVAMSAGYYANYISDELAALMASTHRTLNAVYEKILVVPAGRVYFLASNGELYRDMAQRVEQADVQTQLIRPYTIDAIMAPDRLADMQRGISRNAALNTDMNPVLYYYHLRHWLSRFNFKIGWPAIAAAAAILGVYFYRMKVTSFTIFTTGFAASTLELVLLLAVQILFGSLYHQVGLIVTLFMAGLAIGSYIAYRLPGARSYGLLLCTEFGLATTALILPAVIILLNQFNHPTLSTVNEYAVYPLVTLGISIPAGMAFPLASKLQFDSPATTASRLYRADYLGACLGALLAAVIFIPVLGITGICILVGAVKMASLCVLGLKRPFRETLHVGANLDT